MNKVRYVGLDLGSKTVGIATSQGIIVSPYKTINFNENDFEDCINKLTPELKDLTPEKIIVGYPKNMDGTLGHRVEMVEHIIYLLTEKKICNLEDIIKIDERLTTRMAKSIMISANISRQKQKQKKDTLAAQLILETYLANKG
ncbi:Holliday junction resolvase RuvX [Spiroplasma endosymbiont of Crioceris asparagi]|uniref:Holliday junction resolvase RuvX n=1 Tax=Spiroplasma endosymbiont of Crioceris asparagi TaxID=3066286 RepID=UPI0030CDE791